MPLTMRPFTTGRRATPGHLRQPQDLYRPGNLREKSAASIPASLALMSHYVIEPVACTPASGWEKGQVEKQVQDVRRRCFTPRRKVDTPGRAQPSAYPGAGAGSTNTPPPGRPRKTVWQRFEQERTTCAPGCALQWLAWSGSCGLTAPAASSTSTATPTVSTAVTPIVVNTARVFADRLQVACPERAYCRASPASLAGTRPSSTPGITSACFEHKPGALAPRCALQGGCTAGFEPLTAATAEPRAVTGTWSSYCWLPGRTGLDLLSKPASRFCQLGGSSAELVLNTCSGCAAPSTCHWSMLRWCRLQQPPQANRQRYDSLLPGGQHVSR